MGKIEIDKERCKGCAYCVEACPVGVIETGGMFNNDGFFYAVVKYPEKCTGCAICANMCPDIAIAVYRDDEKKRRKY